MNESQRVNVHISYTKLHTARMTLLQDLIKTRSLYFTCIKRLERNDALEGIHSLPMQKIFTKRDAKYSKKVSGTTVS